LRDPRGVGAWRLRRRLPSAAGATKPGGGPEDDTGQQQCRGEGAASVPEGGPGNGGLGGPENRAGLRGGGAQRPALLLDGIVRGGEPERQAEWPAAATAGGGRVGADAGAGGSHRP